MTATHLVALWNPSYAADALDMHAQLLLEHVRRADEGDAAWDDAYVWWGRVRSPNRQQPLEHLPQVLALNNGLDARDELQLYLTDYRSLYVAEVIAVEEGDKKTTDAAHTPEYYRRDGLSCDCWFKLADIRALVHDDTLAVQEELRKLRVITYNDRPVSLYGGMVNLPLLVRRPDGTRFFDEDERDLLNHRAHVRGDCRAADARPSARHGVRLRDGAGGAVQGARGAGERDLVGCARERAGAAAECERGRDIGRLQSNAIAHGGAAGAGDLR